MDTQQIFDKAVNGVIKQGGPSLDKNGYCSYRGKDNKCCAAGHIIDDKYYKKDIEGRSSHNDDVVHAIERSIGRPLASREFTMIGQLQCAHDDMKRGSSLACFRSDALQIAEDFKLSTKTL